ncbi:MAG: hypothetical protein CMB48_05540 [Euryarchaeota archaeon]|nr:hypothetical protein [Euryarchaeota archaeon]|tara:strand:+ start:859 stop:2577 length:1719 start_codon:yes stop_codon:yes gene_type:complete
MGELAYRKMKRFASIDFLRGLAIVMMLLLHVVMDVFAIDDYINKLDEVGAINLLALLIFPYLGGLAGLFLMVSAMGNMVGMRKNLEKGFNTWSIAKKQVVGGFLIVIFAHILEATLGYHGSLGQIMDHLNNLENMGTEWSASAWRSNGYHFETIHTIGWCVIINGVVQGYIASKWDLQKDSKTVIKIYWILAGIVLIMTPLIWELVSTLIPGYPWENSMWKPVIGESPWYDFIIMFFVNPLAAPVEPIFPYLATSFLGSLIALHMTEPRDVFDRNFVKRIFGMGCLMFIVGFVGVVVLLIGLGDFDAAIDLYKVIYDHRKWTGDVGVTGGWFWQWMTLNGASLMIVTMAIRVAEYRGNTEKFASITTFFRRFGFVAFTVYIIQWIYFIMHFIVSSIYPDYVFFEENVVVEAYDRMPWIGTWLTLILTLVVFHYLLKVWSKKGYIGSVEWGIVTIANKLTLVKKQIGLGEKAKWWQQGRLNVEGAFDNPEWISFDVENVNDDDKRLLNYFSWAGFIFVPFSIVSLGMVLDIEKNRPEMDVSKNRLLNIISITFFLIWFVALNLISLSDLGVSL